MLRTDEILSTVRMLSSEHLDVRTVTIGIDLNECAGPEVKLVCKKIAHKITSRAARLVEVCDAVGGKYKIPVVNKRLAVSPISNLLEGHSETAALEIAKTLDDSVAKVGIDLVGGFTALVERGQTPGQKTLIRSLPKVLSSTQRVCSSVNVAGSKAGINMDAIALMGETIKEIAEATKEQEGFGCAKLVVFANVPGDNPFMAGAYLGSGQGDCVINIGVSGPGVVKSAVERAQAEGKPSLGELAEVIKQTAFRVTRVGELIGREVAAELGVPFGIVDLSLAPTPTVGDSVGEIFNALGIKAIGAAGTTAALAMLNDAVKKGGLFASSSVGGLSGAFIPVLEDANLAEAARKGHLTLEKLEAMTCVCSVGLDMILVPGDTTAATISGIIADEMAIGVINNKTTAVRLIPVPGKKAGDEVSYGGLFGAGPVMHVRDNGANAGFVESGGQIPASVRSLTN
ncbi:MAG: PFL family protein [Sedimentisphaerales bacterium]|nr:PFL family protein [Sedimentisphaerales bacterium]